MSNIDSSAIYGESFKDKLHRGLRETPWWAISMAVHVLILLFAYTYTWEIPLPKDEMEVESDLTKLLPPPPVMLELPKPVNTKEVIDPIKKNIKEEVKLKQENLPDVPDISQPSAEVAVLANTGGVMAVGRIGDGSGLGVVTDAGGAMDRMTGWNGWKKNVLAVWLFDESKSMKDDQQLVRQKVVELYESLGVNAQDAARQSRIRTAVCSYGKDLHILLKEPVADLEEIRAAIDKVPVDSSGEENFLKAINGVLAEFQPYAKRYRRNIVIIIVTDERGDDDEPEKMGKDSPLEATIANMKKNEAALLVFGGEAGAFGFQQELTYDPTVAAGTSPYAWVDRGIESAFSEMLPHDWYFRHTQRTASGFGPYALSRICHETGGVYYLLRDAKATPYDYEKLLNGYEPEIEARSVIASRDKKDSFRRGYMKIIDAWDAVRKEQIWHNYYYRDNRDQRMEKAMEAVNKWLAIVNEGIDWMKNQGNINIKDSPRRWEANKDLMWAQLHKERFQLIQYRLALADLMREYNTGKFVSIPPPGDIGWAVSYWRGHRLRGDDQTNQEEIRKIREMFQVVIDKHADTPWAQFARSEMRGLRGVGIVPWSSSRGGPVKIEKR